MRTRLRHPVALRLVLAALVGAGAIAAAPYATSLRVNPPLRTPADAAACVTVNVWPAMGSVPGREVVLGLAATE